MLAPPTSASARTAPDPTKLKSRKFASGRSAASSSGGGNGGISSIWTETPEQKLQRLSNAVLGREDPSSAAGAGAAATAAATTITNGGSGKTQDEARVRAYVEQTRGRSLVEEHAAARASGKRGAATKGGKAQEEDDDPSKRAFDKEKDMALGGRINNTKRRELLNKAADFGGRFQTGKYL